MKLVTFKLGVNGQGQQELHIDILELCEAD